MFSRIQYTLNRKMGKSNLIVTTLIFLLVLMEIEGKCEVSVDRFKYIIILNCNADEILEGVNASIKMVKIGRSAIDNFSEKTLKNFTKLESIIIRILEGNKLLDFNIFELRPLRSLNLLHLDNFTNMKDFEEFEFVLPELKILFLNKMTRALSQLVDKDQFEQKIALSCK